MPRTTPGSPSRMTAWSYSGARCRRVSQPSYTCPLAPNVCGVKVGGSGLIRFSLAAKNSSVARTTLPPNRRDARSGSLVKSLIAPPGKQVSARAAVVDALAAQPGRPHPTGDESSVVRGEWMPVVQNGGLDRPALLRREDAEVGICAHSDSPLARQAGQSGWRGRHPARDVREAMPAPFGHRPDDREPKLERRDTTPRGPEIAARQRLQRRWARTVVGNDEIDQTVAKPLPEPVTVRGIPDRRAALVLCRAVRDVLSGQAQIMRARLGGDPYSVPPCISERRQRARTRQVHDVDACSGHRGQGHQASDGLVLRLGRP